MPSVFVVGHKGMLGHVVVRVFREAGWLVQTSERRFTGEVAGLIEDVRRSRSDVVVNCAGVTPARADARTMLTVNGMLPQLLALLGGAKVTILASSDGVFSGARGGYAVTEAPDAVDDYGLSKRLGELAASVEGTFVLRTSIVGPEASGARSLLSWYLSQSSTVTGYVDQRWNGITTLSWARLALRIAERDPEITSPIQQPACHEPVTKAELLHCIRRAFGRGPEIAARESGKPLDRTLLPTIELAGIEEQLRELADWYGR